MDSSVEQAGEWYFTARPCRDVTVGEWIGWCAKTPNLGNGPLEIDPSAEVHAEFGATKEDVLRKLKAEVLS